MVHLIHLPKVTQLERTGIIDFSPGPLIQNATCFSTLFLILCVVKIREKSRLAFSATPLLRGKESSADQIQDVGIPEIEREERKPLASEAKALHK